MPMPAAIITTASIPAAPSPASPQAKPLDGTSTIRTRTGAGPPVGWPKRLSGARRSVVGSTGFTASGVRCDAVAWPFGAGCADVVLILGVLHHLSDWRAALDALLSLPGIDGPVGYEGMTAIGIRLAVAEPRISAAVLFGQGLVPDTLREEARQVAVPLQFLMQWDDEGMERQPVLDLFDAFGTREKTLHANLGGHAGTPWFEVDDAARFFTRHLR